MMEIRGPGSNGIWGWSSRIKGEAAAVPTSLAASVADTSTVSSFALASRPAAAASSTPANPSVATSPATSASPAAVPVAAPAFLQPPRLLEALNGKGFELLYRRRLWIPFLTKRWKTLTPEQFAEKLEAGCKRLEVARDPTRKVAVRSFQDVNLLSALHAAGHAAPPVAQPALATTLRALEGGGYCFRLDDDTRVETFEAYKILTGEFPPLRRGVPAPVQVQAWRHSMDYVILRSREDAHRVRFFRVDGDSTGLLHPEEAKLLKDLPSQGACYWSENRRRDAEAVYADLFQGGVQAVQVGSKKIPLVNLASSDLSDRPRTFQTVGQALEDFKFLNALNLDKACLETAWQALGSPHGNETFQTRTGWLKSLLPVESSHAEAIASYGALTSALSPSEDFVSQQRDYAEVRKLYGAEHREKALESWLQLRAGLPGFAGTETFPEKRSLYLRLLPQTASHEATRAVWNGIAGPDSALERVSTYERVRKLEKSNESGLRAWRAAADHRRPGETLADAGEAFAAMRGHFKRKQLAEAIEAFACVRDIEGQPGVGDGIDRGRNFRRLLERFGKLETARNLWTTLGGQDPKVTDVPERIDIFLRLFDAQEASAKDGSGSPSRNEALAAASEDMKAVLQGQASHALGDRATLFLELGKALRKPAEVREAFRFVENDLEAAVAGPWSPEEKRDTYLGLLEGTPSHEAVVRVLGGLSALQRVDLPDGPRLPELLAAFEDLRAREQRTGGVALVEILATVVGARRAGETVEQAVQAYGELRAHTRKKDFKSALEGFRFVRQGLPSLLPGVDPSQLDATYLKVLAAAKNHEGVTEVFNRLKKASPAPADLAFRLDAFGDLWAIEPDRDRVFKILDTLQASSSSDLPAAVQDYRALREHLGSHPQVREVSLEGLRWLHAQVPAAERSLFHNLHGVLPDLPRAQAVWARTRDAHPAEIAESLRVLTSLLGAEKGKIEVAEAQLEGLHRVRRPGESLEDALTAFSRLRAPLSKGHGRSALAAFEFGRTSVPSSHGDTFMDLVHRSRDASWSVGAWRTLEGAGSTGAFDQRLGALLSLPPEQWKTVLGCVDKVSAVIPAGVDRDRAWTSLFRFGAFSDPSGLPQVLAHLDLVGNDDPTGGLEWLCEAAAYCGTGERLGQTVKYVYGQNQPGTRAQRESCLLGLLSALCGPPQLLPAESKEARRREKQVGQVLDVMQMLARLASPEYAAAAANVPALFSALAGQRKGEARKAVNQILEGHARGRFGNRSLNDVFLSFATHYGAAGSVESALEAVVREARLDGGITQRDNEVIIGGIRVPRKAVPEA